MMRAIETRLRNLESTKQSGQRRLFVFEGQSERRELIASGVARADDLFIATGVQRSPNSYVTRRRSE